MEYKLQQYYYIQMRVCSPYNLIRILPLLVLVTQQASLKTLSQSCLCDVTDNCDSECCCDSQCLAGLTAMLGQYGKCSDDSFGIPLCSNINTTDLHMADLYSGLRTIYTVVKRLFCIQRINIIDPTSFYVKTSSDTLINSGITQITQTSIPTLQPSNVSSLTQTTITGIFTSSEAGICVRTNTLPSNIGTGGMRQCRALLAGSLSIDHVLSMDYMRSVFPNIRIFSMGESSSLNPMPSTASSSCAATICSNIIRYLKLFINPSTGVVRQDLSYVVVGDLQNVQTPSYIIVKYQYVYLNEDGSFANVSNVGYKIGSPLQLLKRNQTNEYLKVHNPLNLAYRQPDGSCRTASSQSSDESIVQLRLGRNEFHTCIGNASNIYNNLKNSFDLIGIMGSSNTVQADYISITWPSLAATSDSSNVVLKIQYVKVGSYFNPQYYVAKATAEILTNSGKEKTLFIQYQQVDTTYSTYIPPPPKVDAYLPNDFLFPFYVAQ